MSLQAHNNEHADDLQRIKAAVSELDALCQAHVRAVALRLAAEPESDADSYQNACYEMAFAAAEISAAHALCDEAAAQAAPSSDLSSDLSRALAIAFAATTLPQTILRLRLIGNDVGHEEARLGPLTEVFLRAAPAARLDALGDMIIAGGDAYRAAQIDSETDMARDMFWRLGQDIVAPLAAKIHREDLTIPDAILTPLKEMGAFGLSIPETYGGSAPTQGSNTKSMIAITEALSAASLGAAGSLITRPEILSRAILKGGTPAQKTYWLPRLARGEALCAISITEPDFGSDAASLTLKATPTEGGWLLNGAKTWCTFAGKADVIMVVARTENVAGHKGLSILLVEKPPTDEHAFDVVQENGGRMRGKAIPTIGYRGMHSYDMAYEDFFVPDDNLLGGEAGRGQGFYLTMAGMTGGRIQTAARACGVMAASIDAAVQYAGDRKVFGRALGTYQLTRSRVAVMAARYRSCRALAYAVAALMDEGGGQMQASLVKLIACRAAETVTRDALQIFGGMGYGEETPVSRYFVDARVLSIFEGAEETLAMKVVARDLLKRAASDADM